MKKSLLIASLMVASAISAFSVPHVSVSAKKNGNPDDKGVTVTKQVTTKKGTTQKTTYVGEDTGVGQKEGKNGNMHYEGVVKNTTVTRTKAGTTEGKTVSKMTRVFNSTETEDGAPTATKMTTVTGPEKTVNTTSSKSISQ